MKEFLENLNFLITSKTTHYKTREDADPKVALEEKRILIELAKISGEIGKLLIQNEIDPSLLMRTYDYKLAQIESYQPSLTTTKTGFGGIFSQINYAELHGILESILKESNLFKATNQQSLTQSFLKQLSQEKEKVKVDYLEEITRINKEKDKITTELQQLKENGQLELEKLKEEKSKKEEELEEKKNTFKAEIKQKEEELQTLEQKYTKHIAEIENKTTEFKNKFIEEEKKRQKVEKERDDLQDECRTLRDELTLRSQATNNPNKTSIVDISTNKEENKTLNAFLTASRLLFIKSLLDKLATLKEHETDLQFVIFALIYNYSQPMSEITREALNRLHTNQRYTPEQTVASIADQLAHKENPLFLETHIAKARKDLTTKIAKENIKRVNEKRTPLQANPDYHVTHKLGKLFENEKCLFGSFKERQTFFKAFENKANQEKEITPSPLLRQS